MSSSSQPAPPDADTLASRSLRDANTRSLRVICETGANVRSLPDVGDLVIGRGVDADVRIDDASISRKHALLSIGPQIRIKDLGSANGTRVGDRALDAGEWATVVAGEVIDVGDATLIVVGGCTAKPSAAANENAMQRAQKLLDRIAPGDINVLLLGETGVGKEVFAERIHAKSRRAGKPLLRLNCGGFSEALLDNELFGHDKGAFTGAERAKPGLLENADGGTVFLDEIGELPLALQARLLRVIQDKKVQRLGALEPRAIDVRFIAATNRDLGAEIAAGRFRQDLFYRLDGITLAIPPLRERTSEIATLATTFLAAAAPEMRLSRDAVARLERHAWPGNVRELKNVIERAALLADDGDGDGECREIAASHLQLAAPATSSAEPASGLRADVEALEKQRILAALEACGGNQTRAAQQLGIARGTLLSRMTQFGIKRPRS